MGFTIRWSDVVLRIASYLVAGIRKRGTGRGVQGPAKVGAQKEGESLTDLKLDAYGDGIPGPTDRTTEIVARDVFLDALDDPELAFEVYTQRQRNLDSAVQIAQYMEAVMHSFPSRPSKPLPAVRQAGDKGKIKAELKYLRPGKGTCWMS